MFNEFEIVDFIDEKIFFIFDSLISSFSSSSFSFTINKFENNFMFFSEFDESIFAMFLLLLLLSLKSMKFFS